ncbi:Transcription initiation factor TFIID subunit 2 [Ascochyta clinopodiicola]|nr:Transcription initiation factor TFIID subunit 2 [Ascochyta clinopodiicola]
MAPIETPDLPDDASTGDTFTVLKQSLELDISFSPRRVTGKTVLDIQPKKSQLREIVLNCRQLRPTRIRIDEQTAGYSYSNLHERLTLYPGTGLEQYHFAKDRIARHVDPNSSADELVVFVPDRVKIREVRPEEVGELESAQGVFYAPLKLEIEYVLDDFRDALHFVGVEDGDGRLPHAFTRSSPFPGTASCLFPCIDDGTRKCLFDVAIRYPRTLGDALSKAPVPASAEADTDTGIQALSNGTDKADSVMMDVDDELADLSAEERAMEMQVICSGALTDDIADHVDASRKTASFTCDTPVLPQHIGFVIGPFEHVDLSEYRDTADDERLGSNAVKVHAFCLPGKEDEVRNSAMMLARALDSFTERFQSYAFGNGYKLAFVDDLDCDTAHTASFSICSTRLLFPETVWEPLEHTTRVLVHAVASQWIGVDVVAYSPYDYWIIVGGSWFMAELYLRELFGRNDWRFRQKQMVDKIIAMDHERPSLIELGPLLQLHPAQQEFMEVKALLVLSVLHNRLVKQSGKNGVDRCLYRMLFNARQGKYDNGAIATDDFLDICEKVGHQKLETFFKQWIEGSGFPTFTCDQQFNKKKQVVVLTIQQEQNVLAVGSTLSPDDFMRKTKESMHNLAPTQNWPVFLGPMTIRIHEADGTPYEHIVEINASKVKVEIPYNTKYKRLKRNRLNKERMAAAAGLDASGDAQEDVTFYMLGDVFASAEEQEEWKLGDWPAEVERLQEGEAYEWIRIDADFEWICKAKVQMPSYMYVSQLQQDKDVVAQAESIQFLATKEDKLISTFLVKTLMDNRYFHGIRTMAADVLAQSAKHSLDWIGLFHLKKAFQDLFCLPGSPMTRSNDFSDRSLYLIQCAIPKAIARIKGENGKAPMEAKRFLLDLMRYNDNRGNDYSDDHYISTLMRCLAESLISIPSSVVTEFDFRLQAEEFDFTKKAIEELTRHQRLDEWIPTFHNIYTTTGLDCSLKLVVNRVMPFKPTEFSQYAQLGNADNVRLKAWECLVRLGMVRKDSMLRFMMHEIRSDPSPYFRKQLLLIFDIAVGQIATGDVFTPNKSQEAAGGLVIDQEADNSARASSLARQSLAGALNGLKQDLVNNQTLRLVLEEALNSKTVSLSDMTQLLDFCDMIFRDRRKNSLPVKLRFPRYWKVKHLGQARLQFTQTDRYRTKPLHPLVKEVRPAPAPAPVPAPVSAPATVSAPTPAMVALPQEVSVQPPPAPVVPLKIAPPTVVAPPKPKLSLKFGKSNTSGGAFSPPPPSALSRVQPTFSPPIKHASPAPMSAPPSRKASPAPQPTAVKQESPVLPPKPSSPPIVSPPKKTPTPTLVVKTPVPLPTASPAPAPSPAAGAAKPVPAPAQPRPKPAPVNIPKVISAPSPMHSPIPSSGPKIKIKTKTVPGSSAPNSRPSTPAPSRPIIPPPRPSAAPASAPRTAAATPAPRSTPVPPKQSQSKVKRSKIVKLKLSPDVLARFKSGSSKKRKLQSGGDDRPFKRQSVEPNGLGNGAANSGLVKVEKLGGEKPKLIVKMKVDRFKLPAP